MVVDLFIQHLQFELDLPSPGLSCDSWVPWRQDYGDDNEELDYPQPGSVGKVGSFHQSFGCV